MNIPCICGEPELDPHAHIMADNHVQMQFQASEPLLSLPWSLQAGTTIIYIQAKPAYTIKTKKSSISFKKFSKDFLHVEHFKLRICETHINYIYI